MTGKDSRNPNSAPVAEKHTGIIEVKTIEHPDTKAFLGDFYQFSATTAQLQKLQTRDPITRWKAIVRGLRLQRDMMPPRTEIGSFYAKDGEHILKEIEGDRLRRNLASGSTLEQISEKREAVAAQKRRDWLDTHGSLLTEGITVGDTPTGDLKPEHDPRKSAKEMVEENVKKGIPRPTPKRSHHKKKEGK